MCFGFRVETFSDHLQNQEEGYLGLSKVCLILEIRYLDFFSGWLFCSNYVNRIDDIAIFVCVELFSFLYLNASNLWGYFPEDLIF